MAIFDTDLTGATRTGTPGALEATVDAPPPGPEPGGQGTQEVVSNNPGAKIHYVGPMCRGIQQDIYGRNTRAMLWPLWRKSPFSNRADLLRDQAAMEETSIVTITATMSDDIDSTGASGGWITHAIGLQDPLLFRSWVRWSAAQIALLTSSLPITKVELLVNVPYVAAGSVKTFSGGPYGESPYGQTDPSSESGLTRFSHCDVSGRAYFSSSSSLLTTGEKEIDLGADAITDINACRVAGAAYAFALRQTAEDAVSSDWAAIDGYTQPLPPRLRVTFSSVSAPTITDAGDEDFYPGETGVVITGTGFGASKGTGRVELNTASDGSGTSVTQTDTSWADTSITFTVVQGGLPLGALYLIVHDDDGQRTTGWAVTLSATGATGAAGVYGLLGAHSIFDAPIIEEPIAPFAMAALTGDNRIGVGDIRLPIVKTYNQILFAQIAIHTAGGGWTWDVVDFDTDDGPRVRIYDNTGVLADATISAFVRGI